MRTRKKAKALCVALALMMALVGCAGTAADMEKNTAENAAAQPVTLRLLLRGSATGLDRVLAALYEQMDPEHSWRLDITLTEGPNYGQQLASTLTAHDDYDLVFDAPWISLNSQAEHGAYKNLKSYFEDSAYPALRAAFSREYLDANRVGGELFAIPFTNTYYDIPGIFYRRDLLKGMALGFDSITTRAQMEQYWAAVQGKGELKAMSLGSRGFYLLNLPEITERKANIWDIPGWGFWDYPAKAALSADGKTVLDVVFPGDDPAHFAKLPAPYQTDFLSQYLLENAATGRYLDPDDLLKTSGNSDFTRGLSASYEGTIGNGGTELVRQKMMETVPGAEVGFWPYDEAFAPANRTPGSIPATYTAWNYLCVPSYSDNTDETMAFLNWLYSDWDRIDMLNYGVEGQDWQANGTDEYTLLANPLGSFSFPSYELAWNPQHHRIDAGLEPEEKSLMTFMLEPSSYTVSPLAGFNLQVNRISIEMACLNALYKEYYIGMMHGAYGADTAAKIAELHSRSEQMGLETVRTELISQMQQYLDTKA